MAVATIFTSTVVAGIWNINNKSTVTFFGGVFKFTNNYKGLCILFKNSLHWKIHQFHYPNVAYWISALHFIYIFIVCWKVKRWLTLIHRGINWFEFAPSWCEQVDLKQFYGLTYPWRRLLWYYKSQIIFKFKNLSLIFWRSSNKNN